VINCGSVEPSTGPTTFGTGRDLRSLSRASRAIAIASSAINYVRPIRDEIKRSVERLISELQPIAST
jgi:hypothetical protein